MFFIYRPFIVIFLAKIASGCRQKCPDIIVLTLHFWVSTQSRCHSPRSSVGGIVPSLTHSLLKEMRACLLKSTFIASLTLHLHSTKQCIHKHNTNYTIEKYMQRKITQCKLHASIRPDAMAAPRGGLGGTSPPVSHQGQFSNSPKSGEKRGGGYDSGIKSRNTGLGKFQNKRHSCSNIFVTGAKHGSYLSWRCPIRMLVRRRRASC